MAEGRRLAGLWIALWIPLWVACASPAPRSPELYFFGPVSSEDLWQLKIRAWQAASRLESPSPLAEQTSSDPTPLAEEYARFSGQVRLEVAQRVVRWVQINSGLYFRSDNGRDHWPTLDELITAGGDDCDGMELLTFNLLRRLGFTKGELYRAILFEPERDAYHMVTLWFDDGDRQDPYVLDPSGEVSRRVERLSHIASWQPVVMFDERSQFKVEARKLQRP